MNTLQEKTLSVGGLKHILLLLFSFGMLLVSIYLTHHYFLTVFPTGVQGSALCHLSEYFDCDKAIFSRASNIFGVPISALGLALSFLTLLLSLFPQKIETNHLRNPLYLLHAGNVLGCILLLLYSIIFVSSLCPFCLLYYIFSAGTFFILLQLKTQEAFLVTIKEGKTFFILSSVAFFLIYLLFFIVIAQKKDMSETQKKEIYQSYNSYKKLPEPSIPTPLSLHGGLEERKIKIHIFSDFQCPACRYLGPVLHELMQRFPTELSVDYYPYPLDQKCNPNIKQAFHPVACQAAAVALCAPQDFSRIHDELFENQDSLNSEWLQEYAKKLNVTDCAEDPNTMNVLTQMVKMADQTYKIRATPSLVLNGVLIEGILPVDQLSGLIVEILKNEK